MILEVTDKQIRKVSFKNEGDFQKVQKKLVIYGNSCLKN